MKSINKFTVQRSMFKADFEPCTLNFEHLAHELHSVINKVTKYRKCSENDHGGVASHKSNLQVTRDVSELRNEMADAVHDAVDKAEIKTLPQSFGRKPRDGIDDI